MNYMENRDYFKDSFEKEAYDVIRRVLRDIANDNKSDDYKAGYVQGVVDLQTEIHKKLDQVATFSTHN